MKVGKISNTVLDRSIVKVVSKKHKSKLLNRPGAGHDCGAFIAEESGDVVVVSSTACGNNSVYTAVNNLAAEGVKAVAVSCSVTMPATNREIALKRVMSHINDDCLKLDVEIAGGHTQVSAAVTEPIISVTAMGVCHKDRRLSASKAKPEQDIIMTKWIGIGGVQAIIDRKREELVEYFNESTVNNAYGCREQLSILYEADIARKAGVTAMHDASNGGIYAALWDLAEAAHVGLDVDFREIKVAQEIIEVCERYDLNPYELDSTGCLLMTAEDGCAIVDILENNGIVAAVIGRTTAGNDRIIRNREETRYLEAPKQDEIYRFQEALL
ncbi:MAG: hydrogenase maturation factor [Lachnospira sp.]|nr:hydrogenase maturation factor [Lachnospira sp.]